MNQLSIVAILVSGLAANVSFAGYWNDALTPDEQAKLIRGEQVIGESDRRTPHQQESEAPIWKEVTVYQLVYGAPAFSAGAFFDYAGQPELFREANLRSLQVLEGSSYPLFRANYELAVNFGPINQTTRYTLENHWARTGENFSVAWNLFTGVGAPASEDVYWVEGSAHFEAVRINGSERTLIRYYNYINPKKMRPALNNGLARRENRKQVAKTVQLLRDYVNAELGGAAARVRAQKEALCRASGC